MARTDVLLLLAVITGAMVGWVNGHRRRHDSAVLVEAARIRESDEFNAMIWRWFEAARDFIPDLVLARDARGYCGAVAGYHPAEFPDVAPHRLEGRILHCIGDTSDEPG